MGKTNIQLLQQLNTNITKLTAELKIKNEKEKIKILQTKDVARILGCNNNRARDIMLRPDFPSFAGSRKVEESALYNWLQTRHDGELIDTKEDEKLEKIS